MQHTVTAPVPIITLPSLQQECCGEARTCVLCERITCNEHSDPFPVNCEVHGFVCGRCHDDACFSTLCALTNADPDML